MDSGNNVNCCLPVIGADEQPANKKPPQHAQALFVNAAHQRKKVQFFVPENRQV
jgi:hypothetical protein